MFRGYTSKVKIVSCVSKESLCSHSVFQGMIPFDRETLPSEVMGLQFKQRTGVFFIHLKSEEEKLCKPLPLKYFQVYYRRRKLFSNKGVGKCRFYLYLIPFYQLFYLINRIF